MNVIFEFSGKVALVTGAASGVGRATAKAFAKAGAQVAVADLNRQAGEDVAEQIRTEGGVAEFFHVDVGDEASVAALVASVVERFGGLDFAHNNAGIEGAHVPVDQVSQDDWQRVMDVDLSSVFYCMKSQIPEMAKRGGGAIVNTASASGLIGGYQLASYTAAKHGVVGLTRAAAADCARHGIRVNALCPGPIDTAFIAQMPQAMRERLMFGVPMRRLGTAEEMALPVLWLCSDAASYVTRHALSVDGGVVSSSPVTFMEDLAGA